MCGGCRCYRDLLANPFRYCCLQELTVSLFPDPAHQAGRETFPGMGYQPPLPTSVHLLGGWRGPLPRVFQTRAFARARGVNHPAIPSPLHYARALQVVGGVIADPKEGNAQVLGALLARGDPELVAEVDTPVKPSRVMYAGLDAWMRVEGEVIDELGLRRVGADSLATTSSPVLDWIANEGITQLAIHFDVDVLDPRKFGPVLFNEPGAPGADGARPGGSAAARGCCSLRRRWPCHCRIRALGSDHDSQPAVEVAAPCRLARIKL